MTSAAARRLAERIHAGTPDRYGAPLLDHVRRVALSSPKEARAVAWLHETLECSNVSREELRAAGVSSDELAAVELLTRDPDPEAYKSHIAQIAKAPGHAGELARAVKHADLVDRLEHQNRESRRTARPPYRQALHILAGHAELIP